MQTIIIPFDESMLPIRMLKTGSLTCMYEHGKVRYVKCNETEVLRMIYFAVRDENWQTASYTIHEERIEENANGFSITYTSLHQLNDIDYQAVVTIDAVGNSISFLAKGKALTSFKRNRIGICVHHPIREYSGKEVLITRPDATTYTARFPELISPHQPFKSIRKIGCALGEKIKADLIFEGDIFETEDQRNWSDSSYKTYSTPLDLPLPVEINKGEILKQKMQLTVMVSEVFEKKEGDIKEEKRIPFPKIGYSRSQVELLNKEDISLLKGIPFNHYRMELFLYQPGWQQRLQEAAGEAAQLETKLELILFFTDDFENQLRQLLLCMEKIFTILGSVLILQENHKTTPFALLNFVYEKIKKQCPGIKIGYGTNGFFADLNRNRPVNVPFDFISFSLTPQAHASDTRSVIENLERQSDIIKTAQSFAGNKHIFVSPVTFKVRADSPDTDEPHRDYDLRQHTFLGALWTLSAIKNLSEAQSLTFYEAKGYRGVLYRESKEIILSPLYQLLKEIKEFNPKWIIVNSLPSKPFTEPIVLENEQRHRKEYKVTDYANP